MMTVISFSSVLVGDQRLALVASCGTVCHCGCHHPYCGYTPLLHEAQARDLPRQRVWQHYECKSLCIRREVAIKWLFYVFASYTSSIFAFTLLHKY